MPTDVPGHTSVNKPRLIRARVSLGRIHVQVTIYRRLQVGRDVYVDQSDAYHIMS